jgi:hypothetical protein
VRAQRVPGDQHPIGVKVAATGPGYRLRVVDSTSLNRAHPPEYTASSRKVPTKATPRGSPLEPANPTASGPGYPVAAAWGSTRRSPAAPPQAATPADGVTCLDCDPAEAVRIGLAAAGGKNLEVFSPRIGRQLLFSNGD